MKRLTWLGIVVLVVAIGMILVVARGRSGEERQTDSPSNVSARPARTTEKPDAKTPTKEPRQNPPRVHSTTGQDATPPSEQAGEEESAPLTEEEKRERAEEALVKAFDTLTDKWMEPAPDGKGVTMEDVRHFADQFRKLPKNRQDECLHRALNLVPDENVMLLAGILMDKTLDKEILETVYSNVLNRDENVKKPILQQIFKDREHPCWADTAWILDVTGQRPAKK